MTLLHEEPVRFRVGEEQLVGLLHLPAGAGQERPARGWPALLMLHGFTGHKAGDHRLHTLFARQMAARGVAVLRFDFRGYGDSQGDFAAVTPARQLEDVQAAAGWLRAHPDTDPERLMLLGHSLGGLLAAQSAASVNPHRLALWAPALPDYFLQYLPGGQLPAGTQDLSGWPLGRPFLEEVLRLNPLRAARQWGGVAAVLHGDADEDCPSAWGERYAEALGPGTELALIEDSNHTFDNLDHIQTLFTLTAHFLLGEPLGAAGTGGRRTGGAGMQA
ncbi:alpha/beta hydrolase family protein [Deinococcus sp. Marseille-Q6407]|uniref:alpha/beta hydrolase family protein n=1 Tax=Deinococcus sp. Marseille-Q6407 TaxID=2969223 RepID=UPI0021BE209E|nr:alpha/beta fold hydrolase [Deinococcus sp. Marseille-Q6407]